ncbi:MAG TPA: type II toxin-antitoxin system mRNA interferase toxin, RelE/StbE family [Methanothrix sp.]|nr:type II toxin-antitoxin system mRNA interferase toxin, RelE/StbE family [Methanothrix sp.]
MTFHLDFAPQFQRNFKRLTKKDTPLRERVLKRIEEIAANPEIGENLSGNLAGKQSTHVAKHWAIIYQVYNNENKIEFQNFDHHDFAYCI